MNDTIDADTADIRARIMHMINSSDARAWRKTNGRTEIAAPHIPIGWVPVRWTPALTTLVDDGTLTTVDLPRRVDPTRIATFVVLA